MKLEKILKKNFSKKNKIIPSKFHYDLQGSKLFEKITKTKDLSKFAILLKELLLNNEAKTIKEGIENYLKNITNKNQFGFLLKNSKPFYKFHMKDKFILSDELKLVRSELKEENVVLDYYSKDSIIDIKKQLFNIDGINIKIDTSLLFSNSLKNARNLKTSLSINS